MKNADAQTSKEAQRKKKHGVVVQEREEITEVRKRMQEEEDKKKPKYRVDAYGIKHLINPGEAAPQEIRIDCKDSDGDEDAVFVKKAIQAKNTKK